MATHAIHAQGLTKDYGSGRGIFDLDLEVSAGEIVGFIGPNGAGKTTTIRLLMDFTRPTRGRAEMLGLDSVALKRLIGYLPGELPIYPGVTAAQVIGLLAAMRGGVDEKRAHGLAERLQLELGRRYQDLSHGNKQKVWLVQAFMHSPKLLILDEPTLGLDPLIQAEFHALLQEAAAGGATVFLSSHVLSEVQTLCDRIALVSAGRLLRRDARRTPRAAGPPRRRHVRRRAGRCGTARHRRRVGSLDDRPPHELEGARRVRAAAPDACRGLCRRAGQPGAEPGGGVPRHLWQAWRVAHRRRPHA